MADFNLTKMAVNMYCPGNVVQIDDANLPSVMVWIPAFKLSDVLNTTDNSVHPAFIVNGKEIPGFYYSKYQNVVHNGNAYSLPAEDPAVIVDFYTSLEYCEAKGYGWHMSTAAEWAAIALWCKKYGSMPYGNNNNGKDNREGNYYAIPTYCDTDGTINRVATGTGPLTWSHDGTMAGIWDMNGNVWEWQSGFRMVWGEIQILANNDAVDPDNPQNITSTCWKAINAADGSLVDPESKTTDTAVKTSGRTVKLDYVDNVWKFSTSISNAENASRACLFGSVACDATISDNAKAVLRAFALLPDVGANVSEYENDRVHWNNAKAECCVFRGGSNSNTIYSGVFSINGTYSSTFSGLSVGFRSAYIPNI